MSFGGGGGGTGNIHTDGDVALSNPADGDVLTYNAGLAKWENQAASGGNTSVLKAVCVYSGSAYPTRPSGYGSVEFIGPVDPGAAAQTNDTWVNTA